MDSQGKSSKKKWIRIAWILFGVAVLAGGALVTLNMSAAEANGADAPQDLWLRVGGAAPAAPAATNGERGKIRP